MKKAPHNGRLAAWLIPLSLLSCASTLPAATSVTPTYSVFSDDAIATDLGGTFTVPTAAENYNNEVWERPYEDNKWSDSGGTRTATGKYYAYNDIHSIAAGFDNQYLYLSTTVVGGYVQDGNSKDFGVGLKGHYYVYFSTDSSGKGGFLAELSNGTSLGTSFSSGSAKLYRDVNNNVGGDGGLTTTFDTPGQDEYDDSDGFESEEVTLGLGTSNICARRVGDTVEFAIDMNSVDDLDVDYLTAVTFVRFGVATSNPSGIGDLLVNDEFTETIGSGVEYDTAMFEDSGFTIVPEPTSSMLIALSSLAFIFHRKKLSFS